MELVCFGVHRGVYCEIMDIKTCYQHLDSAGYRLFYLYQVTGCICSWQDEFSHFKIWLWLYAPEKTSTNSKKKKKTSSGMRLQCLSLTVLVLGSPSFYWFPDVQLCFLLAWVVAGFRGKTSIWLSWIIKMDCICCCSELMSLLASLAWTSNPTGPMRYRVFPKTFKNCNTEMFE